MRIVTIDFNYHDLNRPDYHRLMKVFRSSCERVMPDAEFRQITIDAPDTSGAKKIAYLSNTVKLRYWVDEAYRAIEDGENLILIDCDMLCLADASSAFDDEFDIGYTVRNDHKGIPLNGGVVFVKPTKAAGQFCQLWLDANERMYRDWGEHNIWHAKYAGMNQASFGYVLEQQVPHDAVLKPFECLKWNAVDTHWQFVREGETVFCHIKSGLRKAVLRGEQIAGTMAPAMLLWYEELERVEKSGVITR